MLNFSANLTFLFNEHDFLDRFGAAARAGFKGVEFHFPYDFDKAVLAEVVLTSGVEVAVFNLPAGNWAAGERGIACLPERKAEFQDGVGRAIEYAEALGCTRLNCLAGIAAGDRDQALETLVDNLRFAAAAIQRAGIRLLLEPLNNRDNPGFLVPTTAQALQVLDAVGSRNLQVQYDVYHAQVMEGDLSRTLETHLPRIGHIQIADNPGRHEPGTGEIRFPFLFERLEQFGYAGWIGCEYKPSGATLDSFGWLAELG
ncbi:MAG: hydroxypyruvate isomerase [Gammaproteobacteria bacterium]|nr:hydroxypyruvate isomerase [Rhodocyclaceae bacterium]MBU3908352.1 hydroxypyruvate isomerase [Gammaproteobacteria bacterium]MBU3987861.1 hydroxypyruvate isomerase [Gammaproteobacteria bacterium]MBU4004062.1 hydroxypyruvate isomerase [Gammaproteobacteria bacterium]MBU4020309.1 hydroxypyruvate isomerase [Gammaproteobacteria bacterium]